MGPTKHQHNRKAGGEIKDSGVETKWRTSHRIKSSGWSSVWGTTGFDGFCHKGENSNAFLHELNELN